MSIVSAINDRERQRKVLPTYFFSNSPVKCLLTNVVLPTPPSPTRINLNSADIIYRRERARD
jgi:hypothetical protein